MSSPRGSRQFTVYGYRWVVLAAFMLVNIAIQVLWIAYAPITGPAARFYGVTDLKIGLLAMSFMIVYIPLSIPVSWVIDTYGFRPAVNIGAVLMAVFGLIRGMAGADYTLVLVATIGIAVAQPFLLNAWTKVPAVWFSLRERATAVGLITLSSLIGVALGMVLTPLLIKTMPIPSVQLIYGGAALVSSLAFLALARGAPPTPPCPPGMEARALMLDGLKHVLTVRQFLLYLIVWFIGSGIFNGISTWVEDIVRPRGFMPSDAGDIGALMLIGGILGAVILPPLSDRQRKRRRYLILGLAFAIPGLVGLTYATNFRLLLVSAFFLGFFLVSAAPIGMQYAAEITQPTPEGTSNGVMQLIAQASVVFVYIMDSMKSADGEFTPALILAIGLVLASVVLCTRLKDPA